MRVSMIEEEILILEMIEEDKFFSYGFSCFTHGEPTTFYATISFLK